MAKILTEKWFYVYGVPKRIHSDQGRSFVCMVLLKVELPLIILRVMANAKDLNRHYLIFFFVPCHLNRNESGCNCCHSSTLHIIQLCTTQHSLYELIFSQKPKLPVDHLLGSSDKAEEECSPSDWVVSIKSI